MQIWNTHSILWFKLRTYLLENRIVTHPFRNKGARLIWNKNLLRCEIKVSLWLSKSECTGVLALPQNLPWASVTRDLLDQIHKPTSPFYKLEQVFLFASICICIVFVFVVAIVQWSQRQWDQLRCYHKPTLITSLHRNLNLSICNRPGQPSFHSTKTFWTCIISSH